MYNKNGKIHYSETIVIITKEDYGLTFSWIGYIGTNVII